MNRPENTGTNSEGDSLYPIHLSLAEIEELLLLIDDKPVDEVRLRMIRRNLNLSYKQLGIQRG